MRSSDRDPTPKIPEGDRGSIRDILKKADYLLLTGDFAGLDDMFRRNIVGVDDTWDAALLTLLTVLAWTDQGPASHYDFKWGKALKRVIVAKIERNYSPEEAKSLLKGLV